ncbi:Glycine/D-amino acid oxidase [Variovorax sp. YR634]|uniref:NAD(P)/FAD-dependent oxidoreductase n=1 Tax=unclassified Variovorax TaxID=663243 RepID=UPI000895846E|nr:MULTISPECIES: FAD-dependent oxidoreductase [unclassified Variovorax]SDW97909.1 Glycine/D-amino acid oxidase [Variovorax sp. YR634]SOD28647.1 Glycine/D-amino acid oxidase [Variovorax sp. YR752]
MSGNVRSSAAYDAVVIGGGVMGCSTALHLAQGGMRVALVDRGPLCREASGVNAGTLTLHMTRAALVPYAMRAWQMWMDAEKWLGMSVLATHVPGLTLAFTEAECELVELRAKARREYGAPIEVISPARAREIEPGVHPGLLKAGYCDIDGFASAYLTGRAFRHALTAAGVDVLENAPVEGIDSGDAGHVIRFGGAASRPPLQATRVVLAGGVWIENMLAWLGVQIPIKVLINQLIITERVRPVMRTVLSVANGLLSLKQFANGTVLIGGGWQGEGDRERGGVEARPQNLVGNMRLAAYALPALAEARIARIWLGLEAETADAMPIIGDVPGVPRAYVVGSAHSGYTSGPFMGRIMAQHILGQQPELPLFDPARLLGMPMPGT